MKKQEKIGRRKEGNPHPADAYAGKKLRELRVIRKMTQTTLAKEVGVTFQQLQKYEKAANRMSLSAASKISEVLQVKPDYFFEEWDYETKPVFMMDRLSIECAELFQSIADKEARQRLLIMFKGMAELLTNDNDCNDKPRAVEAGHDIAKPHLADDEG